MAWSTPGTVAAGDVYTAAAHNVIAEDLRVLGGVAVPARSTITNQTTSTTSTSFTDTGLSVSITPTSTTSLVEISFSVWIGSSTTLTWFLNLVRGSTNIAQGASATCANVIIGSSAMNPASLVFIDAPSTTSATTYKLQWRTTTGTIYPNRRGDATDAGPISYLQAREIIQP